MTEEDNKMTEEHEEQEHHDEHRHEEEEKDSDVITINRVTFWKIVSAVLGVLLVVSIFIGGFGKNEPTGAVIRESQPRQEAQPAQQRQEAPSAPSIDMVALIDDDTIKGDKNAPVTIVEWSDFECPFCGRFYTQALPSIENEYINTGKVKLVYRDFPLSFHANAQKAAEAAECAGEQGKFWEMHDKLFEEGVSGGVDSFKQFAEDIGLDAGKFNECLDSGKMTDEIKKDISDGSSVGISGTPGFIINGQLVVGAQPFENFKQVIDAELAK